MNELLKSPRSLYIAATATVVAGAAAVYVERERRKTTTTKKKKKSKQSNGKNKDNESTRSPKEKQKSSKRSSSRDKGKKDANSPGKTKATTKATTKTTTSERKSKKRSSNNNDAAKTETIEPKAPTATPECNKNNNNKKVVVLISSYGSNLQTKTAQERAMTILKGLKVGGDQLETIDGASPGNREKRNELFGVSGIRAKYPQFFVVDQNDKTTFLGNWEDFEAMNDMGCLEQSLNLA